MRTHPFELTGQVDVVLQVVLGSLRIEDVARVADRRFADGVGLEHGVHRDAHVGHPVEGVEHAEHVDARIGRFLHERLHHVVGIVRVADRVRSAEQHLEQDVGNPLAKQDQSFPGTLLEEPHRRVERRAAPHLQREQFGTTRA